MSMNIALTGLKAATTDLNVISDNIANSNTTGFKSGRAEFGDLVGDDKSRVGGIGVQTQAITQQFTQGGVVNTGNPTDLAIVGEGFFVVKDATGSYYTRAGAFHVDKDGYIVNNLNQRLQNSSGDMKLSGTGPWGNISMDSLYNITALDSTGAAITPIPVGLVNFPNVQGLQAVGDTNWKETTASGAPSAIAAPQTKGMGKVLSGALEASNVDLSQQLVNMIVAQRNFQANAQVISTDNTLAQTVINIR
ncbi:MAG TPA: flagellar hook basal-body protein [Xanthomonadaceae bacterium]|nr:flagellar hook basal-body protein [Xanthomonadaceae bacterium]